MKKTVAFAVLLLVALPLLAHDVRRDWPFPDYGGQPVLVSETIAVAHLEAVGAGHGASLEPRWAGMRILYNKARTACWIGNLTEPHQWIPAPAEVCR
jgi:hypothetical protein